LISIRPAWCSSTRPGLRRIWRAHADAPGAAEGYARPHGHYKTVTLIAGLRLRGLVAQKAFDRPINAASFEEWVEKCLVPTLSKGDIVVMDNLSSHKGPRVEHLINAAGAELRYLPPYSPDMSPIEKAYSKLKALPHAKSRSEPSRACWPPSTPAPTSSNPRNAPNTSRPADMIRVDRSLLQARAGWQ
jgi:transposase